MPNATRNQGAFDRSAACAHLDILFPDPATVALCHPGAAGSRPDQERHYALPGQASQLLDHAEVLTGRGIDVYLTVLPLKPGARRRHRDTMVDQGTVAWVELDGGKAQGATVQEKIVSLRQGIAEIRAEGGYIVWSGGGAHCYFLLDSPLSKWDIERVNRSLVLRYAWAGADPACTDSSRFLRLPGTWNHKPEYGSPQEVYVLAPWEGTLASSASLMASAPVSGPPAPLNGIHPEDVELEGFSAQLRELIGRPALEGNADLNASGVAFGMVQQAKREGMTPGQLLSVTWHWNATPSKYAGRWAAELERAWLKPSTLPEDVVEKARENRPRKLKVTRASEIKIRPVRWVWDQHLAQGTLGLLAGREGIGKSTIAYWVVAQVTQGRLEGQFKGQKRSVVIVATEDSWEHTIVPRLMAAGADLELVLRVDSVTDEGRYHSISLPEDIDDLTELIREENVGLVLLDPLMSRLGVKIDSHNDKEVRTALEPLTHMADVTSCAIIGLIHLNKRSGSDLLSSVMASRAFTAVARSVMFAAVDPEDDTKRYFGLGKNNLGRSDIPARTYEIENTFVADTDEGEVWTGAVRWTGESDETIADITSSYRPDAETRAKAGDVETWLEGHLPATEDEAMPRPAVIAAGAQLGYSSSAIDKAKKRLGVRSKSGGFRQPSFWWRPVPMKVDFSKFDK